MKTFIVIFTALFLGACGQEGLIQSAAEVQEAPEPTAEQSSEGATPAAVTKPTAPIKPSSGGGGGGGSSPPQPECTVNEDCQEGFECVEESCVALPECREDIPCVSPNDFCSEAGTCEPKPCTEDSECTEPALCLVDRANSADGIEPKVCREKTCPVLATTIDPTTLVVNPDLEDQTLEELQVDIDFTIGQLELAYPDLSVISENIKICEIPEQLTEHQAQFDELDAVRVLLDNHLAHCNVKKQQLEEGE